MQWNIVMFFILIGFTELFFRSEVLLITFRQANPLSTARGYGVDPATRILCSTTEPGSNSFFLFVVRSRDQRTALAPRGFKFGLGRNVRVRQFESPAVGVLPHRCPRRQDHHDGTRPRTAPGRPGRACRGRGPWVCQ
jgi:hypothetical protein